MSIPRRSILATAVLSSTSMAFGAAGRAPPPMAMPMADHMNMSHPKPKRPDVPRLPVILCRTSDTLGVDAAYGMLQQGSDTLDSALKITRTQEDDPNDFTTGVGGLPDADGAVRLDACCFHGPTGRSAAVAGVGGLRNASLLAQSVMQKTGYNLLAGEGARLFGIAQGLPAEAPSNDRTDKMWSLWKQVRALPGPVAPGVYDPNWPSQDRQAHFLPASQASLDTLVNKVAVLAKAAGLEPQWTWRAAFDALFPSATPLFAAAVNAKNEMSCAATTSGLPWRMPGAVSDVAMLGAGCYLDPAIGAVGASGNAEANIRIGGAHSIVQSMRSGMLPENAGMDALRRVAECYKHDMAALRFVEIVYYVLRKDGAYACVSLWRGDRTGHVRTYTVHDGLRRSEPCLFLFNGSPLITA